MHARYEAGELCRETAERLREILRKAHSLGIVMRLCVKQIINQ